MRARSIALLPLLLVALLGLGMLGCGDDEPVTPDEPTDPRIEFPGLHSVNCTVDLPDGCELEEGDLTVCGLFDDEDLGDPEDVLRTAIGTDILLFILGPNDERLGVAYASAEQLASGQVEIGVDEMALGLILMNPFLFTLSKEDKRVLLSDCVMAPEFQELLNAIEEALIEEPENATNPDVFPDVIQLALELGWNAMEARYGSAAGGERLPAGIIGSEDNPHLEDAAGNACDEVNPKMCFYGVEISNSQGESVHLISAKPSLWSYHLWPPEQWQWPPTSWTEPVRKTVNLPEGVSVIKFCKGGGQGLTGYDIATAHGRATHANVVKVIVVAVDTVFICPIDNETITNTMEKYANGEIIVTADINWDGIAAAFASDDKVWEKIGKLVEEISKEWDNFALFIWESFPGTDTVELLSKGKKALDAFGKLLKDIAKVLEIEEWANSKGPFLWDLVLAPYELTYRVRNTEGDLSADQVYAEPEAEFSFIPSRPLVGDEVSFDASASKDDYTPKSELLYRWDIDYDDDYETGWLDTPGYEYSFSNAGAHYVRLEVEDSDGLVGKMVKVVYVKATDSGGTSNHIMLLANRMPWDSTALEDMLKENGFTEGPGEYQYEYVTSSELSEIVFSPGNDLVVIVNDQDQTFYNDLYDSMDRIKRFVDNGGTLFWGACDRGWGLGSMEDAGFESLLGGVTFHYYGDVYGYVADHYNYNVLPEHPIMQGLPEELYGNYASHEFFMNLVPGTTTYTIDSTDNPTLIEYDYGDGHMIVTGQPLEHGWKFGWDIGLILPRLIRYVLGLDPQGHGGEAVREQTGYGPPSL